MGWVNWFTPYYFRFMYNFSLPCIICYGKSILLNSVGLFSKPYSPIVEAGIEFFFPSKHSGYGRY